MYNRKFNSRAKQGEQDGYYISRLILHMLAVRAYICVIGIDSSIVLSFFETHYPNDTVMVCV